MLSDRVGGSVVTVSLRRLEGEVWPLSVAALGAAARA